MTTYTNISKPSNTSYTPLNSVGREQYDQTSITYDDSGIYCDGINTTQYTNLTKPTNTTTEFVTNGSFTGNPPLSWSLGDDGVFSGNGVLTFSDVLHTNIASQTLSTNLAVGQTYNVSFNIVFNSTGSGNQGVSMTFSDINGIDTNLTITTLANTANNGVITGTVTPTTAITDIAFTLTAGTPGGTIDNASIYQSSSNWTKVAKP